VKQRDKVTQAFLNRLEKPTDMPDVPWIQWRVENVDEMTRFLEDFEVRMVPIPGDQLLIQTRWTHGDIQLAPGDSLVIMEHEGRQRLGVVRVPATLQTMEGDNLPDHSNLGRLKKIFNKPRLVH